MTNIRIDEFARSRPTNYKITEENYEEYINKFKESNILLISRIAELLNDDSFLNFEYYRRNKKIVCQEVKNNHHICSHILNIIGAYSRRTYYMSINNKLILREKKNFNPEFYSKLIASFVKVNKKHFQTKENIESLNRHINSFNNCANLISSYSSSLENVFAIENESYLAKVFELILEYINK